MTKLASVISLLNEVLDEPLQEFKGDLKKQAVVLMGLPAAGKSTFVKDKIQSIIPGFSRGFSTTNSDAQVKRLQYSTARDHWAVLKDVKTKKELQKFIQKTAYMSNTRQTKLLPLTLPLLKSFVGLKDYYEAMNKAFYTTYFDIRELAREFDAQLFQTKVHKTANLLVIDTVAAKVGKILKRLGKAKRSDFQTTIIYLEVDPELSIARDAYRGETEGRTVGVDVIMGYASKMDKAFRAYKAEGLKPDGLIDRLFHFKWRPAGDSPIKGKWTLVKKYQFDVKREILKRKAGKAK